MKTQKEPAKCKCGKPSDSWPDDMCQECWEEYCSETWWKYWSANA